MPRKVIAARFDIPPECSPKLLGCDALHTAKVIAAARAPDRTLEADLLGERIAAALVSAASLCDIMARIGPEERGCRTALRLVRSGLLPPVWVEPITPEMRFLWQAA